MRRDKGCDRQRGEPVHHRLEYRPIDKDVERFSREHAAWVALQRRDEPDRAPKIARWDGSHWREGGPGGGAGWDSCQFQGCLILPHRERSELEKLTDRLANCKSGREESFNMAECSVLLGALTRVK